MTVPIWITLLAGLSGLVVIPVFSWLKGRWAALINKGVGVVEVMPGVTPAQAQALAQLAGLLNDAMAGALDRAGSDISSGNWSKIPGDALTGVKMLITPSIVPVLEAVASIGLAKLWAFVAARLGLMTAVGKGLLVTPDQIKAFNGLSTVDKRAAVASWGHLLPALVPAKAP